MLHRTLTRALRATALTFILTVGVVACADDAEPAPALSATEHNSADVTFASEMLQHHAQALSMVDLTLKRPLDPEIQALAEQVRAAQGPEIQTFSEWLTDWDEEIPATVRDHSNAGHDMQDMGESPEAIDTSMPGMMSADDMVALEEASDREFGALWLEMMIEHHTGAIEMARIEAEEGQFEPAVELAGDIADSQSAEVATMQRLLTS